MTLAVADALIRCSGNYARLGEYAVESMQLIGRPFSNCGYGGGFRRWMYSDDPKPYGSYGNGAAMRVSACGFLADSMEEARRLSRAVTEVTHNHPEGIKGAEATTAAIYLARIGKGTDEIKSYICEHYYPIDFTLDGIRDAYRFNETCQGTVQQALEAFFESTSFEDAIRNAVSIGGDSDTLAAITGGVLIDKISIKKDSYLRSVTVFVISFASIIDYFAHYIIGCLCFKQVVRHSAGNEGSKHKKLCRSELNCQDV